MATNAGIIGILRFQWGVTDIGEERYAIKAVSDNKRDLNEIGPDVTKRTERFIYQRVTFENFVQPATSGGNNLKKKWDVSMVAPHVTLFYDRTGRYQGGDPTVTGTNRPHRLPFDKHKISDDRCRACHNRSARTGLNYHGEMESEQYGTPFMNGSYNNRTLSDDRFCTKSGP